MGDKCHECSKQCQEGEEIWKICCSSKFLCEACASEYSHKLWQCPNCQKWIYHDKCHKSVFISNMRSAEQLKEALREVNKKLEQSQKRNTELEQQLQESESTLGVFQEKYAQMQLKLNEFTENVEHSETGTEELALESGGTLETSREENLNEKPATIVYGPSGVNDANAANGSTVRSFEEVCVKVDVLEEKLEEVSSELSQLRKSIEPPMEDDRLLAMFDRCDTPALLNADARTDGDSLAEFKLSKKVGALEEKLKELLLELTKEIQKSTELAVENLRLKSKLNQIGTTNPSHDLDFPN